MLLNRRTRNTVKYELQCLPFIGAVIIDVHLVAFNSVRRESNWRLWSQIAMSAFILITYIPFKMNELASQKEVKQAAAGFWSHIYWL
jgi:hypothetical protein